MLEGHGQRRRRAVLVDMLDGAEIRRRVGETGLGQEAAHLDARVHAGPEPPGDLEIYAVAEGARRVGVLAEPYAVDAKFLGEVERA